MPLIVLDAGHGGANPGATYNGRKESEDVLALTLAVGSILDVILLFFSLCRVGIISK